MSLRQDLAYSVRALRSNPLFTLTAVLSLAVGIAGAASVFSVADALLFRPAPGVAHSDRLIEVGRIEADGDFDTLSYPDYVTLRDGNPVLDGLAAFDHEVFGMRATDAAVTVDGALVSANYFGVLGVPLTLGRGFADSEERVTAQSAVAVISERLWRAHFGGAVSIVDRTVRLNGRPFTIVGVAGGDFAGITIAAEDVWVPLAAFADEREPLERRDLTWLQTVGRLRPDVTVDVAQAHMQQIARDVAPEHADAFRVAVVPSDKIPESEQSGVQIFIGLLFAMIGLILMIACTNVAGMLVARGAARSRETALRIALGASHGQVIRLLVTESLVIGAAGGVTGVAGAFAVTRAVRAIVPVLPIPVTLDFGVDWRVVGFAIALSLIASVLFGLFPAVQTARVDLQSAMRPDRSGGGSRRSRLRQVFVVTQIAVSLVLVVGAALLARSVQNAAGVDPGFSAENVDLVGIDLNLGGYNAAAGAVFAEQLISSVERLPAVEVAGTTWMVPLQLRGTAVSTWLPDRASEKPLLTTDWNVVSPGFFEALDMPIVRGRAFVGSDRAGSPDVGIVNETFARRVWPGEDPVGRLLLYGEDRRTLQVVGIARDAKYRSIGETPRPFLYRPLSQRYEGELWLLIRRNGPSTVPAVRALVQQMDPNLPLIQTTTLADATTFSLFPRRLAMWTAAIVGIVGLFLASLGLYGITAYEVMRRTREIGIRLAVGATPTRVLRMVVRQAMQLASTGALIGLVVAAGVSQLLTSLLFGVTPLDPASFLSGALLFAIVALSASLIPARRAASADPVAALRAE